MTGKSSRASGKGTAAAKTAGRRAEARARAKPGGGTKSPPARAAAMQLAAEVDALREELMRERARVAELETRVDEDPLTGLLNRRGFGRMLERALAYVRRYEASAALLYLDLDRFKPVNDRHGHAAGDWVLGRVARLIAGQVRASDVVARIGGDELAVLLWNVSEAQGEEKARALESMIGDENFVHEGEEISLGLSAGVTMLARDDTLESALARADTAMYARKRERRANSA
jgi:diguanylate cyclase (GGDEF)-like protein